MKVFIDTNVVVDYLNHREPFFSDASSIIGLCADGYLQGVISSLTVINSMYIARKMYTREDLFAQLDWMLKIFTVSSVGRSDISHAAQLRPSDFEDAVQYFSAKRQNVDYIITRDEAGFKDLPIPSITPADFIAKCKE